MRFFKDGPSIPDQLLERRDQGRVVFLCGAGVSLNAGMPSFYDLAKYVVDFFDPAKDSVIDLEFRPWVEDRQNGSNRLKAPLDQIFHLLYQEYGRDEVNALVANRLQVARATATKSIEHSVIGKISSDQEGRPQIVTTNFDLLFELALEGAVIQTYEPPAFPDISLGVPLTGITYLHGRLQDSDAKQHPYVLGSADFGRAYLSEGWATKFIRSLLKRYTVVLVGYQAEDPPVRYLLQGLNHDGLSDRSSLYAFDKGRPEDIESKWRDRGVTAIACKDYPSLWQSLEAWADRAVNSRQWRLNVIDMAINGPRNLSAHERGQVAHLVRTTPGARLFATVDPSPSPEWLCVFDAWCRVSKASRGYGEIAETFDPFEEYGLDDDPARPEESAQRSNWAHDHILEWRRGDINPPDSHRLGGRQAAGWENMPPRLLHLCQWIAKNLNSPITAWWAARQRGLHPRLESGIRGELRRNNGLHPKARLTWNLILEYQSDSRNFSLDNGWHGIKYRIDNEGWSPSVLRDFEEVTSPILFLNQPLGILASRPPLEDWDKYGVNEVMHWELKFPNVALAGLKVPDEVLESVFRIAEGHLHRSIRILADIRPSYFSTPTCYPDRNTNGHANGKNSVFGWFLGLFSRMASRYPEALRGYVFTWSIEEGFYFGKLKLFAMNHAELFRAEESAEWLLAMPQSRFWDWGVRRELLFLICDRWDDFSVANRDALAARLLDGPEKREHWSEEEAPIIRAKLACRYAQWLVQQGKGLPETRAAQLKEMISGLPEWREDFASSLVSENSAFVKSVDMDETPDTVIDLPVSEVVERARAQNSREFDCYTEKRPFTGLVKARPRRALASLSYLARSGDYPEEFWSALIDNWPEGSYHRLFRLFLHRLGRLPHGTIRDLRHPLGRWLSKNFLSAFQLDKTLAWNTFDHLVSGLASEDGAATSSGIGEIRLSGEVVEHSRQTFSHAINGPIGHAMQGLHNVLNSLNISQGAGIPEEFKSRIERLVGVPGEGGGHAVAISAREICWLYHLDPDWVKKRIVPWFGFDHKLSESAWNGYLSVARLPPYDIGVALKPLLLELFPKLYQWGCGRQLEIVACQMTILLAVFHGDEPAGLTEKEIRHCLRCMNDRNRQDAVQYLAQIGQRNEDGWVGHVIPFINTVWPRERRFMTSSLVSSWVFLLNEAGEKFPEVLGAVRRFLVPIEGDTHWLYQFGKDVGGGEPLTMKWPAEVLELLDAVIPNGGEVVPYDLAKVLDFMVEADSRLAGDRRFVRLVGLIEQT